MKKNLSGQKIGVQMVSATDGSAFTGSVTVSVTGDAGTQATGSVGSGACAHEGNGYHTYAPAQAETNYDLVAFTFTGTGAIPSTVQVYTLPTTGVLAPATADRTLVVDAAGLADANAVKVGPSGSGTAQTARDLGASVLLSVGTGTGQVNLSGGKVPATIAAGDLANNSITAAAAATDFGAEIQALITGGAYALQTDASGYVKVSDGTGTGQIDTSSGKVLLADGAHGGTSAVLTLERLVVASTTTNQPAVDLTGNGTAPGLRSIGGTTGSGVQFSSGPSGSYGLLATGNSASGARFSSSAGNGLEIAGGADDLYLDHSDAPTLAASVWAAAARTLTAATNITSTGGTTVPQTGDAYGIVSSGTHGNAALKTLIDTLDDYVDTEVATIVSRIGVPASSLAADIAALNDIAAADVWAAATRTLTAGTNIALAKGTGVTGFNDLSAAQVNAEVVDALSVDTYAEPGQGAPAATLSLAAKLNYLFKWRRNKADNDGTANNYYADDGTTIDQKQTTTSSGGTVTIGEMATGA